MHFVHYRQNEDGRDVGKEVKQNEKQGAQIFRHWKTFIYLGLKENLEES